MRLTCEICGRREDIEHGLFQPIILPVIENDRVRTVEKLACGECLYELAKILEVFI